MATRLKPVDIFKTLSKPMEPVPTAQKPKLKKLKGIRAVLFDVYGTLFQSAAGDISLADSKKSKSHEKTVREAMAAAGLRLADEVTPVGELLKDTIFANQDIRRSEGEEFPEIDILGVWEDLFGQLEAYEIIRGRVTKSHLSDVAIQYEARVNPVWPMPGAAETIEGLLDKDLSLGIISNAQFYTPVMFEAFLDGSPHDLGFEEIACIWSYQEGIGKPGQKLFQLASERIMALNGIKPKEVLYVGNDMRNDIWPAAKEGYNTALFAGDERSLRLREDHEEASKVTPDLVITELPQLLECIG